MKRTVKATAALFIIGFTAAAAVSFAAGENNIEHREEREMTAYEEETQNLLISAFETKNAIEYKKQAGKPTEDLEREMALIKIQLKGRFE